MAERWIVIPNWADFQHYRERDPLWIKNYRAQLLDDDYLGLSFGQRGLLHGLRLLYAASDGKVRENTAALSRKLGQRVCQKSLQALSDAGLIAITDSTPLALRYQAASPEQSREEKRNKKKAKAKAEMPDESTVENGRDFAISELIAAVRGGDIAKARLRAFLERSELAPFAYHSARQELVEHRSSVRNDCGYVRRIIERYLTEAA
ncbi:MAG: hypothetical protein WC565_03070 [Parcubacteria group bacterium]